ncbi:MAG: DUF4268 domain-containing protein [Chloroflexi bacterium]|nr:DUF4268 domain-containing protein [Chloroflexota bacterium]
MTTPESPERAPHELLGRLTPVTDLRTIWRREAGDFTHWMAQNDNLALLESALDLSLTVEGTEQEVGPFRADLVCRDDQGRVVVVENQLSPTDHLHLGQLLTYTGGLGGQVMVWIAQRFNTEHRKAIDWLNANTNKDVEFFALEVELWRIGSSPIAPKFNVVCRPDVRRTPPASTDLERFWTEFKRYVEGQSPPIRFGQVQSQYWKDLFPFRRPGIQVQIAMRNRDGKSVIRLILSGPVHKSNFRELEDRHAATINDALGKLGSVEWRELPENLSSQIVLTGSVSPLAERDWPLVQEWLHGAYQSMVDVLTPIVPGLDPAYTRMTADDELPGLPDASETEPETA